MFNISFYRQFDFSHWCICNTSYLGKLYIRRTFYFLHWSTHLGSLIGPHLVCEDDSFTAGLTQIQIFQIPVTIFY